MSKPENIISNDAILRYVTGDMNPDEAQAFEAKLKADAALQTQVQDMGRILALTQSWLAAEAPGVEQVTRINIPTLPHPGWSRLWRKAAVAAVFGFGFLSGSITESWLSFWGLDTQPATMAINIQPMATATPTPTNTPTPVPEPTASAQERPRLAYTPPEYRREEDGKIIIETQLKNSGTQAIWVIDGQFQLEKENNVQ